MTKEEIPTAESIKDLEELASLVTEDKPIHCWFNNELHIITPQRDRRGRKTQLDIIIKRKIYSILPCNQTVENVELPAIESTHTLKINKSNDYTLRTGKSGRGAILPTFSSQIEEQIRQARDNGS